MNDTILIVSTLAIMLVISLVAYFKLAPGKKTLPISKSWNGKVNKEAPRLVALLQVPAIAAPMMLLMSYLAVALFGETHSTIPSMASFFIVHQLYYFWLVRKWVS